MSAPTNGRPFRDVLLTRGLAVPGMIAAVIELQDVQVDADAFRVAHEPSLLACELRGAVAVCVYDEAQGIGGLLHLRYVATSGSEVLDLTDNTLSSSLLLMDRFCKELRSAGARKQSWRVTIIAHTPDTPGIEGPAATVVDLVKAYFADARLPVGCREVRAAPAVRVRFDAHEGRLWVEGG